MVPGRQYTPDELFWSLWSRKWFIVIPLVLVTTATIVASSQLHDWFRADMLILIVPQSVPQEYVRATVNLQVRDRLPSISEQILTRTRLERIIRDFDLYGEARRTKPLEAVVDQMRRYIEVRIVEGSESFRVSYEAQNPRLAMQVTERLAGLFIEENLRDREVLAHATSTFLESQLEDARTRLVEQEKRLEAYRLRYGSELPTQLQSNIQVIQNTQLQIQALNEALNRDRDRRMLVARQLADLQSEQFLADASLGATGVVFPTTSAVAQLEAARAELASLELRLTSEHPDVVRAKHVVAELESKVRKEPSPSASAETRATPLTASEMVKRNKLRELQAELESLDRQTEDKLREEMTLRANLQTYQARVEAVPTRESELASLTRDYDTLQSLYRTLLAKKEDSKIAENLERRQVGDQFKVLDPPRLPEKPFRPNRLLIDFMGALGGLAFGIAIAALLEFRDKSVKVEQDVHAALDLPVLAMIPPMTNTVERRRALWRKAAVSVGLLLVLGFCATAVLLTFRV